MERATYIRRQLLAVASFAAWFGLLAVGILVNSAHHLQAIKTGNATASDYVLVILAYTPTNVALMAGQAGLLGGLTSNLAAKTYFQDVNIRQLDRQSADFQRWVYMNESPIVSALRGFVVYLIFIVGANLSLTSEDNQQMLTIFNLAEKSTHAETAPGLYYRFALTVSLLAFAVGFDPTRLGGWLSALSFPGNRPPGNAPK